MQKTNAMEPFNHNTILKNISAILLAGGNSRRMGREKAFLKINGIPLIQYVYNQLQTHFRTVLISANDKAKYSFLGAEVIVDKKPGMGPLMGIASALEASPSDLNFVIACDIPDIDLEFVKMMVRESTAYDGVIPMNSRSQYEPLYGIYKKSMLKNMNTLLLSGRNKISRVFDMCVMRYIAVKGVHWLQNLNTIEDYEQYIKDHRDFKVELRPENSAAPLT